MSDVVHASGTLIGRDEELDELAQLSTEARARHHVLLAGDAGVGKTRLLQELCARTRSTGGQAYVGHCLDLGESALPYLPFSELLDRMAGQLPEIVEAVGRDYPDLARLQPVRRLLGAAGGDVGEVDRTQLFAGVHALLEAAAIRSPLLVVIEDVHWADQSTRELLTFLLTRQLTGPISIVASYRTDDLHRRHPLRRQVAEWSRLSGVARVPLAPLGESAVRSLVSALDPRATESETAAIVARAEGNAFFVEELVGAAAGPDRWVPDELADVLLVRLDRLGEPARELVRTAAVAGRTIAHALLAAVTELSGDALDDALREAVEAHVLVAGEGAYSFRHALLAEAVYDDLLPGQRTRLHARYVAALCAGAAPGTSADLARHARLAGDLDTALAASIRAGDDAASMAGPEEAATHLEYALQLLADPARHLPEGESMVRVAEAATEALLASGHTSRAARLAADQLARCPADAAGDRARLLTVLAISIGLIDDTSHDRDAVSASAEAVALSADAPPAVRARILANHAQVLLMVRHEDAEQVGLEALAYAEAHNLPRIASAVAATLNSGGRPRSSPEAFREQTQAAIERAVTAGNVSAELQARFILGRSYEDEGDWPAAEAAFRSAVTLGERSGLPWAPYSFESRFQLAWVLITTGRWDEALSLLAIATPGAPATPYACLDALRLAILQARGERVPARVHRAQWAIDGLVTVFSVGIEIRAAASMPDVLTGYDEGHAALSRIWGDHYGAGVRFVATALGRLADLLAAGTVDAAGVVALPDAAARLIANAALAAPQYQDAGWGPEGRAWLARARAEQLRLQWLLVGGEPSPELLRAWREAEAAFAAFGHVHELATVRAALAETLHAAGERDAARRAAHQAREAALRLGARPLLERLGPDRTAVAPGEAAALTAREAEILALVSDGLSNGDVAKRLFISTKTVSVHVSNILAKLGAASRTEAAAIARRRGLLAPTALE